MAWSFYRVSLRIVSPIHIGWRKTDNLQQTRPYVLAKTMWGALTARLARDKGNFNYEEIGHKVAENLRFTYFYPTTKPHKTDIKDIKIDIFPWENIDDFSWKYLNSSQNTALNQKTAEEGSLHETEYISPKTRTGDCVYLLGYIFEKGACDLQWRDSLNKIQLGGERGYGWGRVETVDIFKLNEECFEGCTVDISQDSPIINVKKNKCVLAHTLAIDLDLNGVIEPFVGRETSKKESFGGKFSNAEICWLPGSIMKDNKKFEIMPTGLWKCVR